MFASVRVPGCVLSQVTLAVGRACCGLDVLLKPQCKLGCRPTFPEPSPAGVSFQQKAGTVFLVPTLGNQAVILATGNPVDSQCEFRVCGVRVRVCVFGIRSGAEPQEEGRNCQVHLCQISGGGGPSNQNGICNPPQRFVFNQPMLFCFVSE